MKDGLPFEALPDLADLLELFKNTLTSEIECYLYEKDSERFNQVLSNLSYDLSEFTKNIDNWYMQAVTSEQQKAIQTIELKVDEARQLITKAIGMVKY